MTDHWLTKKTLTALCNLYGFALLEFDDGTNSYMYPLPHFTVARLADGAIFKHDMFDQYYSVPVIVKLLGDWRHAVHLLDPRTPYLAAQTPSPPSDLIVLKTRQPESADSK